jgi:hypothetical protein
MMWTKVLGGYLGEVIRAFANPVAPPAQISF